MLGLVERLLEGVEVFEHHAREVVGGDEAGGITELVQPALDALLGGEEVLASGRVRVPEDLQLFRADQTRHQFGIEEVLDVAIGHEAVGTVEDLVALDDDRLARGRDGAEDAVAEPDLVLEFLHHEMVRRHRIGLRLLGEEEAPQLPFDAAHLDAGIGVVRGVDVLEVQEHVAVRDRKDLVGGPVARPELLELELPDRAQPHDAGLGLAEGRDGQRRCLVALEQRAASLLVVAGEAKPWREYERGRGSHDGRRGRRRYPWRDEAQGQVHGHGDGWVHEQLQELLAVGQGDPVHAVQLHLPEPGHELHQRDAVVGGVVIAPFLRQMGPEYLHELPIAPIVEVDRGKGHG